MSDPDDEVGYGKPPKHMRFQKGRSGNPKGRPKGAKNLSKILESELAARRTIVEDGKRKSLTNGEALIKRLVVDSLSGKLAALQKLLDLWRQLDAEPGSDGAESGADSASIAQRAALEAFRRQIIEEATASVENAEPPSRKTRIRKRPRPRAGPSEENTDVE